MGLRVGVRRMSWPTTSRLHGVGGETGPHFGAETRRLFLRRVDLMSAGPSVSDSAHQRRKVRPHNLGLARFPPVSRHGLLGLSLCSRALTSQLTATPTAPLAATAQRPHSA